MKAIGGYFELELSKGGYVYHDTPFRLKSGRASLHYMLTFLKPTLVYVPYYTCDALLEPFEVANVNYKFYEINDQFEPVVYPELQSGQYFLYVNYFDIKRDLVAVLSEKYSSQLIVDCTQAFFMKGNGKSWFFNSCRKFFGVPDGSFLYAPDHVPLKEVEQQNQNYIVDHLLKRFNGQPDEGYSSFQKNERLCGTDILAMSKLTEYLLSHVDMNEVIKKRKENYNYLHRFLKVGNLLHLPDDNAFVPMVYPFVTANILNRESFYSNRFFIPVFWKDVATRVQEGYEVEKRITDHLSPIPVDHRYGTDDMQTIISFINSMI